MKKNILIFLIFFYIILPLQITSEIKPPPETLQEAQNAGERILSGFPAIFDNSLREAKVIWSRMYYWAKNIWNKHPGKWVDSIWNQINQKIKRSIEQFKETINREKEEGKQIIQNFWQRITESFNPRTGE